MKNNEIKIKTNSLQLHNELVEDYIKLGYRIKKTKEYKKYFFFGDIFYKTTLIK